MLETKYYKDMNHNYLIIKCQGEPAGDKYQLKMITDNKIPGLINCSTRYIDGDIYLYYEINSLQPLYLIYENKKMDKMQAIRILAGYRSVLREIQTYLLTENNLLLNPEYIFFNWEAEEPFFIYYPFSNEYQDNMVLMLMKFFVNVIEHQDEQLVDMVYGLCQLAEQGRLSAGEFDYYLEKAACSAPQQNSLEKGLLDDSNEQISIGNSGSRPEDKENRITDIKENTNYDNVTNRWGNPDEEVAYFTPLPKKQKRKFIIMMVVSLFGILVLWYIRAHYILTSRELLLSWILLFTFLVTLVITGALYFIMKFSICSEKKSSPEGPINNTEAEQDYTAAALEDIQIPKYGNTVFLYSTEEIRENKLYGVNQGNKYQVDLSKLPCTIGKIAGCADYCITEASISRMHVKFTGNENNIFMTDLNSTNGTFKNGRRLQPSETVPIEAGDEIRLGKLTFCFR